MGLRFLREQHEAVGADILCKGHLNDTDEKSRLGLGLGLGVQSDDSHSHNAGPEYGEVDQLAREKIRGTVAVDCWRYGLEAVWCYVRWG